MGSKILTRVHADMNPPRTRTLGSNTCVCPVSRTWVQQVRLKHRFHSKKPYLFPRSHKFRIFQAVTDPIYIKEDFIAPVCPRLRRKLENTQTDDLVSDAEEFVYRGCERMFRENEMIAVCQLLPCANNDLKSYRVQLNKSGMELKLYSNKFTRRAVSGTRLENMLPWFQGFNVYIVSEKPKVDKLLKTLRKIPNILLMGGLIDGRLLSKDGFTAYSKLPPIEQARGELCTILNLAAGGRTSSLLESHQQTLTMNLDQLIRQSSDETDRSMGEGD